MTGIIGQMPPLVRWIMAALVLVVIAGLAEQYDSRLAWLFVIATVGVLLFRAMRRA